VFILRRKVAYIFDGMRVKDEQMVRIFLGVLYFLLIYTEFKERKRRRGTREGGSQARETNKKCCKSVMK